MEIAIAVFFAALLLLDIAALKWGFDSRDGFTFRKHKGESLVEETNQ